MATTLNFKDIIDLPEWRPLSNVISASNAGSYTAFDPRGTEDRHPIIYMLTGAASFYGYNVKLDDWFQLASPALAGTYGAGTAIIFHPSQGPRGTLAAGWNTTQGALTTALPATVGPNQLANRGDGRGFKIRIIGKVSGKTEERLIVANSGPSTTPTIVLDSPLSFTPASGDTYEILGGRIFMLNAGTVAAGSWKYYDIATNSFSGNLNTTNLPVTVGTDSTMVALSEANNPLTKTFGEGFLTGVSTYNGGTFTCLLATASSATSITGQASAGDNAVLANEYRNFQIRIVEDTVAPTAVGQRARITSHTAGPSAVYTVPTWTVTPSSSAKFVIENDDDKILLWSSNAATTYNYNITANTWDTTTWAARGTAVAGGCKAEQSYGIALDANKYARYSYIYSIRGGGSGAIDVLDIAGAATGAWSNAITYGGAGSTTFTTGTGAAYDGNTLGGKYIYISQNGGQRGLRFDVLNRVLEPYAFLRYTQGTAVVGERLALTTFVDGATKLSFLMQVRSSSTEFFQVALQR